MTMFLTPKTECPSSAHRPAVAKSEVNLHSRGEQKVGMGWLSEITLPPSRPICNRADNSREVEGNTNERHASTDRSIVCLPQRELARPSETQSGDDTAEWSVTSELDNVLGALTDAKSVVEKVGLKWHALDNVMQEKKKLKTECEEGKKLLEDTRSVLSERTMKVHALESERDAILAALKSKESMLKDAQDEVQAIRQDHDAVVSDIRGQLLRLGAEKDAVAGQMWGFKSHCEALKYEADNRQVEFAFENSKLRSGFHGLLLDQKATFDVELHNVRTERKRLEHEMIALANLAINLPILKAQRDEMEKGRDAVSIELARERQRRGNAEEEIRISNRMLVATQSRKRKLEDDLASFQEEINRQRTIQETVQRKLDGELRKGLCQTCFVSPKDTIPLPCLHWNYCFACLEKHYELHQTCPCCNMSISGVLRCNIPKQLTINAMFC